MHIKSEHYFDVFCCIDVCYFCKNTVYELYQFKIWKPWTIFAVAYIEGITMVFAANQWAKAFIAMAGWRYLWVAP